MLNLLKNLNLGDMLGQLSGEDVTGFVRGKIDGFAKLQAEKLGVQAGRLNLVFSPGDTENLHLITEGKHAGTVAFAEILSGAELPVMLRPFKAKIAEAFAAQLVFLAEHFCGKYQVESSETRLVTAHPENAESCIWVAVSGEYKERLVAENVAEILKANFEPGRLKTVLHDAS